MAQFYGTLSGQRESVATKCGTKSSGMRGTVAGWNIGAIAYANHYAPAGKDGEDGITVAIDGGSNGSKSTITLLTVREGDTLADIRDKLAATLDHLNWHEYPGWD